MEYIILFKFVQCTMAPSRVIYNASRKILLNVNKLICQSQQNCNYIDDNDNKNKNSNNGIIAVL